MSKFITLYEHYCPFVEKNIVIEKELKNNLVGEEYCYQTNVCLNSHECHCGKTCKNKLLDIDLKFS